jgi:phosphopantothenoylcysteine decarboxylase/phosphopantothenate--cysteine ligase
MGQALAEAALALGHQVVIISGPVAIDYPSQAQVIPIVSTEDLLAEAERAFAACDGVIAAAAPCDYRPHRVESQKISKTGAPITLHLIETPDVVAALGRHRRGDQWMVGFALETEDQRFRALAKLERKSCDFMVLNGPEAMEAAENSVEIIAPSGDVVCALRGSKREVADGILRLIQERLVR